MKTNAATVRSLDVLFIGNSYTNRNDLPGLIERLAVAGSPSWKINTQRVIANGMSLRTHWNRGLAKERIAQQHWDYVVLQDQSTMPLKNPQRLKDSAVQFADECKLHAAKVALYLTWARQDAPDRQAEITAAYTDAAEAAGALVVPVGVAWEQSLRRHPNLILHESDKSHPTLCGTYLAACVFYATLLKQSPLRLPAEDLSNSDALQLQEVAARVCKLTV